MPDPLSDLINNVRNLEGTHSVPLDDLFNADFLRKFTKFSSLDEMAEAAGFESVEVASSSEQWDQHVRSSTNFESWDEMITAATSQWTDRLLMG